MGHSNSKTLDHNQCVDLENWVVVYVQQFTFTDETGKLWPGYARMWNACVTREDKKAFIFNTVLKHLKHYGSVYDQNNLKYKTQLRANSQKLVDDTWAAAQAFEEAYRRDALWYFEIRKEFFIAFEDEEPDDVDVMGSLNA